MLDNEPELHETLNVFFRENCSPAATSWAWTMNGQAVTGGVRRRAGEMAGESRGLLLCVRVDWRVKAHRTRLKRSAIISRATLSIRTGRVRLRRTRIGWSKA